VIPRIAGGDLPPLEREFTSYAVRKRWARTLGASSITALGASRRFIIRLVYCALVIIIQHGGLTNQLCMSLYKG
jgi:hypothetical protein